MFLRRAAVLDVGLLDDRLDWGLDWDLWLRLGSRWGCVYVPELLAQSRLHEAAKASTGGVRRLRERLDILRGHGVLGFSPAGVAHGASTLARGLQLTADEVSAVALVQSMPRGLRGLAGWPLAKIERSLRRWRQNAQGVWSDGLVGACGHLWLPSPGGHVATGVELRGHNLGLPGQSVGLRCLDTGVGARVDDLAPEQEFGLALTLPRASTPVRLQISCGRTAAVAPLDHALGMRRAGFRLERCALVAPAGSTCDAPRHGDAEAGCAVGEAR